MAAGGGVCNCAYTDLCHRRIHYPAAASPYRILQITLRSFLFPWFTPAHHHLQLSRIIYQNIIYTEFGLPNSSFSLLRRYMRVWIFILFYLFFFGLRRPGLWFCFLSGLSWKWCFEAISNMFFFSPIFFQNCCWFFFFSISSSLHLKPCCWPFPLKDKLAPMSAELVRCR